MIQLFHLLVNDVYLVGKPEFLKKELYFIVCEHSEKPPLQNVSRFIL